MNFSLARSERITAIVSTLVAVAILAGGVTAFQSHHAPVDDVVQLESDLRFQLENAFRHDPNERARRLVQLEDVTQAWLQSSRLENDREKLAMWLLEATIRSMPGSIVAMPPSPRFGFATKAKALKSTPDVLVEPATLKSNPATLDHAPTPATPPLPVTRPVTKTGSTEPQPEKVITEPVAKPSVAAQKPVRVNLTELTARIAGYHAGLDAVERELRSTKSDNFAALSAQLRQLEEMSSDFQFVSLYYQLLTDAQRRVITPPRPMATTLAEIERRLERSPENATDDFLSDFDARQQAQLDALRQQLASISARIER